MSKQGEEYERFVQDVYKVLNANDGLSNVIVQHDVKLKGISREHQIDVYWQFSYGTVTYRVAVECKDYKNPVTAEKIEAFRSTLLDIGNDIQGIFASRNGFQTGAINVAKMYGIQLMQIREPLESDWEGCIKDIYIKYIIHSVTNVRPTLYVDLEWANTNGVTAENISVIHGRSDCTFVVANKGRADEHKCSLETFINELPSRDEGKNLTHVEKFDNAFIEYASISIKVKAIKFVYDVHCSYDQQHINAMNLAKAVVNNVITGRSLLINIRNDVSERKKAAVLN